MPQYDPNATNPTVQILKGDYPFEIKAVDQKISKGAKTAGSPKHELTLEFYADDTFTRRLATVRNNSTALIDHPATDWKYSLVAKCVGFPLKAGDTIAPDERWIGYRGWAMCVPEPDDKDATKEWNAVKVFYTDKPKLAPRPQAPAVAEEDVPF